MGGRQNVNDCKQGVGRWLDHCKRLQTVNVVFSMQMTVFVMIVAFIGHQKLLRILTLKLTKKVEVKSKMTLNMMKSWMNLIKMIKTKI